MSKIKRAALIALIISYVLAGVNHFVNPTFYIAIIPAYIPFPTTANLLAGCFEIVFGLMLISAKTRHWGAWGIVLMLAAFIPVHVNMVQHAPYQMQGLNIRLWVAWLRLALQPALMWWAWLYTKPLKR